MTAISLSACAQFPPPILHTFWTTNNPPSNPITNNVNSDTVTARSLGSTGNATFQTSVAGAPVTINDLTGTNNLMNVINLVNNRRMLVSSNADISIGAGIYSGDGSGLTNLPFVQPTITQTNFVSGFNYANPGTHTLQLLVSVALSATAVSGAAEMSIYVDPAGGTAWGITNRVASGTTGSVPSDSYIYQLTGFVPGGASYVVTNTSRGAGNAATVDPGNSFLIRY